MKFTKDFLKDWGWDKTISNTITGTGRWTINHEVVFQLGDRFYRTTYSVGATEYQDMSSYEYEPDEIECPEVFPKEVITVVYVEAKDV